MEFSGPLNFAGTEATGRNSSGMSPSPKEVTTKLDAGLDSRLGFQADLRLNEEWELAAQVVAKRRFDDTFHPELTWAFLKWETAEALAFRAGRLGVGGDASWIIVRGTHDQPRAKTLEHRRFSRKGCLGFWMFCVFVQRASRFGSSRVRWVNRQTRGGLRPILFTTESTKSSV